MFKGQKRDIDLTTSNYETNCQSEVVWEVINDKAGDVGLVCSNFNQTENQIFEIVRSNKYMCLKSDNQFNIIHSESGK